MFFTERLYNFTWQLPDKIATGSKPSFPDQVEWLADQRIGAIISLEDIPNIAHEAIKARGINYLLLPVPDDSGYDFDPYKVDQKFWGEFADFLTRAMEKKVVTYVHCSAGITRSVRLVRRFLQQHCPP